MNKIKVALIGFGYWGPNLLRNLSEHPQVDVAYICDSSSNQLKKAKVSCPQASLTQDFREITKNKKVTCAVIAVPTIKHFEISKEFILAGKNVLIEKPMTTTVEEAEKLIRLAEKNETILCVDYPYIFSGPIRKIKSLIDNNRLGKLYYYNSVRTNLGRIDKSTNVFMDLAPHDLAILDYLLNKEQPKEVYTSGSSHIFNQSKYVEDGTIYLKYKSGFIAKIHLSWLSPIKVRNITIAGSKRMLVHDDVSLNSKLQVFNSRVNISQFLKDNKSEITYKLGRAVNPKIKIVEPLYEVINSFIQAVLYKKPASNDGPLGLRVVKILDKINKSLK